MLQNHNNLNTARRYAYGQDDNLRAIVVNAQQGFKPILLKQVNYGNQLFPEIGRHYFVTKKWEEFWPFYKDVLLASSNVCRYGGQEIRITHTDGDLVKVKFVQDKTLNDGWLPVVVLRNSNWEALKPEYDQAKIEAQHIKLKNENLNLDEQNVCLQTELMKEKENNAKLMEETSNLKERMKELERTYLSKTEELTQVNVELSTVYENAQYELEILKITTVPNSIDSLTQIIQDCTINQLTEATSTIQKQILLKMKEEELRKKRLKQQIAVAGDAHLCRICLDRTRTHMFTPCNHFCCCEHCATIMNLDYGACPICRRRIDSVLPVYNV